MQQFKFNVISSARTSSTGNIKNSFSFESITILTVLIIRDNYYTQRCRWISLWIRLNLLKPPVIYTPFFVPLHISIVRFLFAFIIINMLSTVRTLTLYVFAFILLYALQKYATELWNIMLSDRNDLCFIMFRLLFLIIYDIYVSSYSDAFITIFIKPQKPIKYKYIT